jgi:acyl-ACP--UDP-N-acetylglucosamine O-acyltransferase
MANISSLAYVHPEARLADDVRVEAFAYIDKNVEIGPGCVIMSHASVIGGTTIGPGTKIYDGAVIGADPQDFRWKGEKGRCVIGSDTKIYQHVIINRSIHDGASTTVGDNSYIMAQSHIGHDSHVGNYCVLGNGVKIAGDCHIDNYSILSSGVIVHEKCHIGEWTLIKGGCRVNNNVPPYCIMAHNPIAYFGVNAYLLRKGHMNEDRIDDIAKCYRHIYQCGTSLFNAMRRIQEDVTPTEERDNILSFIRDHGMQIAAVPKDIYDY